MLAATSEIIIRQLEREYLPYVYVANANSCVDRLNTEGGRDPASIQ